MVLVVTPHSMDLITFYFLIIAVEDKFINAAKYLFVFDSKPYMMFILFMFKFIFI